MIHPDSPTSSNGSGNRAGSGSIAFSVPDKLFDSPSVSTASSETNDGLRVLVAANGPLDGLITAVALQAAGCEAHVLQQDERPPTCEAVIITEELQDFLTCHNIPLQDCLLTAGRQVLGEDGEPELEDTTQQLFTTVAALHRALRAALPKDQYHEVPELAGYELDAARGGVTLVTRGGERVSGHMLVAADGPVSRMRQQLMPGVAPSYAGYVAWRGAVPSSLLSADMLDLLDNRNSLYKGVNTHFVCLPAPGADGKSSHLCWTWCVNTPVAAAKVLLEQHCGDKHAAGGGSLSAAMLSSQAELAARTLPKPLAALVAASPPEAVTVRLAADFAAPRLSAGSRVVLVGEAGCVARPHSGSAVARAAQDAASLAQALKSCRFQAARAVAQWEATRLAPARDAVACNARIGQRLQGLQLL